MEPTTDEFGADWVGVPRQREGLPEEAPDQSAEPTRSRVISYSQLKQVLGEAHPGDQRRADGHAKALSDIGAIKPLVRLVCPHCQQRNWISPDSLGMLLTCERCLLPRSRRDADDLGIWQLRPDTCLPLELDQEFRANHPVDHRGRFIIVLGLDGHS